MKANYITINIYEQHLGDKGKLKYWERNIIQRVW
jgi:hypothetical protein